MSGNVKQAWKEWIDAIKTKNKAEDNISEYCSCLESAGKVCKQYIGNPVNTPEFVSLKECDHFRTGCQDVNCHMYTRYQGYINSKELCKQKFRALCNALIGRTR